MASHPGEFIGQSLTVKKANNQALQGLNGKIIDETKKTFTIKTSNGDKKILKEGCTFIINNQTVDGENIAMRPEDGSNEKNSTGETHNG